VLLGSQFELVVRKFQNFRCAANKTNQFEPLRHHRVSDYVIFCCHNQSKFSGLPMKTIDEWNETNTKTKNKAYCPNLQ
jgi:hypothetical protein